GRAARPIRPLQTGRGGVFSHSPSREGGTGSPRFPATDPGGAVRVPWRKHSLPWKPERLFGAACFPELPFPPGSAPRSSDHVGQFLVQVLQQCFGVERGVEPVIDTSTAVRQAELLR